MADYSKFIALATRLIDKKGMKMTFVHVTELDDFFDPDTGKYPVEIEPHEVMGVKTSPTKEDLERGMFNGLKLVILIAGDKLLNPDKTDIIQVGGHDYDVKEPYAISPAEDNVLWKIGVEDMGESGNDIEATAARKITDMRRGYNVR